MSEIVLNGKKRTETGKGPMRRLRADGLIPGIIYGKEDPTAVTFPVKELDAFLKKSRNQLLSIHLDGEKDAEKLVLLKEVQQHPFRDHLIHVDFLEVSMDQKQKMQVPLRFTGVSKGVKLGGVLNYVRRELLIECLPKDIPGDIEVDITNLDEGQSIHVNDLQLKEGIKTLNNPMDVLVAVVKAEVEKEEKPEEEEGVEAEETEKKAEETAKE